MSTRKADGGAVDREGVRSRPEWDPRPDPTGEEKGGEPTVPELSVIVPAHGATPELERSLEALEASTLPRGRWELLVMVDGGDEAAAALAALHADAVLKLSGKKRGPSYARNRGAELARGRLLVFVDSDVSVHADTLERFAGLFESRPDVDAAFGSYDDRPAAPGLVSRYRNLLHHHTHQANAGEAETFWAGCGAVRADVFRELGMYDEWHFSRPQIEDIELGRRLRRRGHRILLAPEIQATHLKRWSLGEVLAVDLRHRGMPWMRLILQEGPGPGSSTLNTRPVHRWCVALAALVPLGLVTAPLLASPWPLAAAALGVGGVTAANRRFFGVLWRRGGPALVAAGLPLHIVFYLAGGTSAVIGWLVHNLVGPPQPPPDVAAFREVGVDTWPPVPSKPRDSVWYGDDRD